MQYSETAPSTLTSELSQECSLCHSRCSNQLLITTYTSLLFVPVPCRTELCFHIIYQQEVVPRDRAYDLLSLNEPRLKPIYTRYNVRELIVRIFFERAAA